MPFGIKEAFLVRALPAAVACLLAPIALAAKGTPPPQDLGSWLQGELVAATGGLDRNLSPPGTLSGFVVASPSTNNPNYYFHWTRDSALTMNVVLTRALAAAGTAGGSSEHALSDSLQNLCNYVGFSRKTQQEDTLSGTVADHLANLGEPKFNTDGTGFTGEWGRPQGDGPALRVITLQRFAAQAFDAKGNPKMAGACLASNFYPALEAVIDADLAYLNAHATESSYDLWEETKGHHFYTQLVQRRALLLGAARAEARGDHETAQQEQALAAQLEASLQNHWDPKLGYLVETLDRDGGTDYKTSNLDSGTILGVLHAVGDDDFFGVDDERVLATAAALRGKFQALYPVNQQLVGNGAAMNPGIGRYPEDRYDGATNIQGNPWPLITLGMGELDFRLARLIQKRGQLVITAANLGFYQLVAPAVAGLAAGQTLTVKDPEFNAVLSALHDDGDRFLARVQYHTGADGDLFEQIDRSTGLMRSAHDLTWSYASFLTAVWAR